MTKRDETEHLSKREFQGESNDSRGKNKDHSGNGSVDTSSYSKD